MKAIILAAGQGTRLKKYTENLPKGMLDFQGKSVIERQIEIYRACGIDDISIVRGYAAEKIDYPDVKYYLNANYENTNMVESLLSAKDEFVEDCIVSYSDILFEERLLRGMMETESDFAVGVDDDWKKYWKKRYGKVDFDTESLRIDTRGCIVELGRENPSLKDIDARYIGILKFSAGALRFITEMMERAYAEYEDRPWQQSGKTVKNAYMTDMLNAVIESGREVQAVKFQGGWIEFDTNEDYENAIEWSDNGTLKEIIRI